MNSSDEPRKNKRLLLNVLKHCALVFMATRVLAVHTRTTSKCLFLYLSPSLYPSIFKGNGILHQTPTHTPTHPHTHWENWNIKCDKITERYETSPASGNSLHETLLNVEEMKFHDLFFLIFLLFFFGEIKTKS